jgi:hypothetical protein
MNTKNINIKEVNDDASINYTNNNSYGIIDWSDESIRLPINSVIRSLLTGLHTNSGNIQIDVIRYPWNFLAAVRLFLSLLLKLVEVIIFQNICRILLQKLAYGVAD